MVSRHDIGQRPAVGRDCFGAAPESPRNAAYERATAIVGERLRIYSSTGHPLQRFEHAICPALDPWATRRAVRPVGVFVGGKTSSVRRGCRFCCSKRPCSWRNRPLFSMSVQRPPLSASGRRESSRVRWLPRQVPQPWTSLGSTGRDNQHAIGRTSRETSRLYHGLFDAISDQGNGRGTPRWHQSIATDICAT